MSEMRVVGYVIVDQENNVVSERFSDLNEAELNCDRTDGESIAGVTSSGELVGDYSGDAAALASEEKTK